MQDGGRGDQTQVKSLLQADLKSLLTKKKSREAASRPMLSLLWITSGMKMIWRIIVDAMVNTEAVSKSVGDCDTEPLIQVLVFTFHLRMTGQ